MRKKSRQDIKKRVRFHVTAAGTPDNTLGSTRLMTPQAPHSVNPPLDVRLSYRFFVVVCEFNEQHQQFRLLDSQPDVLKAGVAPPSYRGPPDCEYFNPLSWMLTHCLVFGVSTMVSRISEQIDIEGWFLDFYLGKWIDGGSVLRILFIT